MAGTHKKPKLVLPGLELMCILTMVGMAACDFICCSRARMDLEYREGIACMNLGPVFFLLRFTFCSLGIPSPPSLHITIFLYLTMYWYELLLF